MGNLIGGAILVGFGYWYIYLTPDNCCSDNTKPQNKEIVTNDKNIQIPISSNQNVYTGENFGK